MQVGSFWTQPMLNSFALPARATRIARYGAYRIEDEQLRLLVRIRSTTEQTISFDVFVVDKRGTVLLSRRGSRNESQQGALASCPPGPPV